MALGVDRALPQDEGRLVEARRGFEVGCWLHLGSIVLVHCPEAMMTGAWRMFGGVKRLSDGVAVVLDTWTSLRLHTMS